MSIDHSNDLENQGRASEACVSASAARARFSPFQSALETSQWFLVTDQPWKGWQLGLLGIFFWNGH